MSICGCLGCREDAAYRIRNQHDRDLVVCERHAEGHQTLGVVGGEVA